MTTKLQTYCVFLVTGILFFSLSVQAQKKVKTASPRTQSPKAAPVPTPTPAPGPTWEQRAIRGNVVVSGWFDSVAEVIDLFLAGQKVTTIKNQSSVRIENSTIWTEGEGATNGTAFNINLRLPNVEETWNLKFTSYDEERERRGTQNAQFRRQQREQNYGATIGIFRRLGDIRTSFQPRIELQDPLKTSHSLAFETTMDVTPTAQFYPKVDFFAGSERGTGIFNQLNFGFTLNPVYSLGLINQSTYEDKTNIFAVANGVSFSRPVLRNASIAYSFFFNSDNQGAYSLVSYTLATRWNQLIYRNILEYNLTPHIDFAKNRSFTGQLGFDVTVSLKF